MKSTLSKAARAFALISLGSTISIANLNAQNPVPEAPTDLKAPPTDAIKSETGLASKVITKGTGKDKPSAADTVTVHYSGWTTDGNLFDSSVRRGQPATFPLNRVIKGWTEGLQLMVVGEKRRFWIPADLAYGENPGGGRPGGMLIFDVELIEFVAAPKAPEDVAKAPENAETTDSGLASKLLEKGSGDSNPKAADTVTVHYSGWTTDGKLFDSSITRGEPTTFPLDQVIPGWTEGVQLMTEGEKRRFWIPAELAYGKNPPPGAPAGTLVFDIELVDIKEAPKPPEVPADVAKAPADAQTTDSGLASKVLKKGTGDKKPTATDTVTVHYSGWTTEGKLFDSSVARGEPTSFPLNRVIKGWTEGVQLMVVGEKRRFWIPAGLAYGDNPGGGRPGGMLVFDVELLEIR